MPEEEDDQTLLEANGLNLVVGEIPVENKTEKN
jgi:hypothetical protein